MATIGEQRTLGFPFFHGPNRDKSLKSMDYLFSLAAEREISIDEWDIEPFCYNEREAYFPTKTLFELFTKELKSRSPSPRPRGSTLEKALSDDLIKLKARYRSASKVEIQKIRNALLSNAHQRLAQYETDVAQAMGLQRLLDTPRKAAPIHDQINAVLKAGFYRFFRWEGATHQMTFTTPEIVLNEVNRKAGLEVRVNLGEMQVRLTLTTLALEVHPHKGNTFVSGILHPFIKMGQGGICWGQVSAQMEHYRLSRDLVGLMGLLQNMLLSTGSNSNPYVAIQGFHEMIKKNRDALAAAHRGVVASPPRGVTLSGEEATPPQEGIPSQREGVFLSAADEARASDMARRYSITYHGGNASIDMSQAPVLTAARYSADPFSSDPDEVAF